MVNVYFGSSTLLPPPPPGIVIFRCQLPVGEPWWRRNHDCGIIKIKTLANDGFRWNLCRIKLAIPSFFVTSFWVKGLSNHATIGIHLSQIVVRSMRNTSLSQENEILKLKSSCQLILSKEWREDSENVITYLKFVASINLLMTRNWGNFPISFTSTWICSFRLLQQLYIKMHHHKNTSYKKTTRP